MRVHKIVHSYLKQFVTKVTKHELKRKNRRFRPCDDYSGLIAKYKIKIFLELAMKILKSIPESVDKLKKWQGYLTACIFCDLAATFM